jgi:hypothetical protein
MKNYLKRMIFNLGYVVYFLKLAFFGNKKNKLQIPAFDKKVEQPLDPNLLINSYAPKRKFRWILSIPGIDSFVIKSCNRPRIYLDYGLKLIKSGTVVVKTYDPISPSAAHRFWKLLHNDKAFNFSLKLLDNIGNVVERWDFKQGMLTSVDFGTLDYSSADVITIKAKIHFSDVDLVLE